MQNLYETSLNFDTLVATMRWTKDRRDLISFMSTCSDLYNAGLPILLGLHYQIDVTNLPQFHEFLVSKGPASFTALRSLKLYFNTYYYDRHLIQDEVDMLDTILTQARNLQRLEVCGEALHQNPSLHHKVASFSALTCLDFSHDYASRAEQRYIIAHLQAPLTKLVFTGGGGGGGVEHKVDIVTLLSNFRHTLEELTVWETSVCQSAEGLCYPKLVHLKLVGIIPIQLSLLVPAFPNLESLELGYMEFALDPFGPSYRTDNIQFQRDHPSRMWRLQLLKGDTTNLQNLGLQTQVTSVVIMDCWWGSSAEQREQFTEILLPLRPMHLSLEGQAMGAVEWPRISSAIAADWMGLVQLDLKVVDVHHGVQFFVSAHCFDKLFHELRLVSASQPNLLCISVTLDASRRFSSESTPAVKFLDELQMDVLAVRAVQAIPTLKAAKFVIETDSTRASYWIGGEGGGLVPVLSQDEASACQTFNKYITPLVQIV